MENLQFFLPSPDIYSQAQLSELQTNAHDIVVEHIVPNYSGLMSLTLGRGPKNKDGSYQMRQEVTAAPKWVSRDHARLSFYTEADGRFVVTLKDTSPNGTHLNGRRLGAFSSAIKSGDMIVFGPTESADSPMYQLMIQRNGVFHTVILKRVAVAESILSGEKKTSFEESQLVVVQRKKNPRLAALEKEVEALKLKIDCLELLLASRNAGGLIHPALMIVPKREQ